ncbi:DUF1415 domain-containing protein [Sinimarinibacterium sp. NLF-5-8]|uniref:DUF1415 domain-containing protein n=1 Tax=Sinimarinibacterium sp. NLF-5-8 TaxID=2698684 RepID=UPI00137BCF39|nr:DUF1415 domain-containing protein [Sinimarinibacterium sp. NLF-5-8]QHS10155.1 DUF1415 domain-containing protein [Sinimarinibacterium sp. NLF-5-8]
MNTDSQAVETRVRQWIQTVVLGLNLCPFAAQPYQNDRVRIVVSDACDEVALLTELQLELTRLSETRAQELETTLIAIPHFLQDFLDYNDFLDQVDALLEHYEWDGEFQVASFHPQYQFEGTTADDRENYTNRAPLPLLHLLREDSVEAAIASHPNPEGIPLANIRRLQGLTPAQWQALFGGA